MIMVFCGVGLLEEAHKLFDKMGERDFILWTVMIRGYAEVGQY